MEDAIERLSFIAKIEEGLPQSEAGQLVSHDEVKNNSCREEDPLERAVPIQYFAAIHAFIAQDSPHAAQSVVLRHFIAATEQLALRIGPHRS